MKPGDFIEWVYKRDNSVVVPNELMWSMPMQKWVPIGGTALLVGLTDDTIVWLSDRGLYHACVDDKCRFQINDLRVPTDVVPRIAKRLEHSNVEG